MAHDPERLTAPAAVTDASPPHAREAVASPTPPPGPGASASKQFMATTLAKSLRGDKVSSLQLRDVYSVSPTDPVRRVVSRMAEQRTGCALVMRDGKLEGIFTERDFLSRVVAQGLDVSTPVEKVMTRQPRTIGQHDSVHKVVELMETEGYRHVPVMGENGQPIGVLSVKDIVHYLVEYFPAKVYNLPPTPDQTQPAREGA